MQSPRSTLAAVAALLGALAGCATPHVAATDLASRARANPVAAERDFHKKHVVVEGVVRQTSLAERRTLVASVGYFTATAEEQRDSLPVIILEPGTVLCYFEPEDLAAAAEIKEGQAVRLECTVDSIRVKDGQVLAVLAGCDRE